MCESFREMPLDLQLWENDCVAMSETKRLNEVFLSFRGEDTSHEERNDSGEKNDTVIKLEGKKKS